MDNNLYKIYQIEKKTNLTNEVMEKNVDDQIPYIIKEVLDGLKNQLKDQLKNIENEFMKDKGFFYN
jgi:hypothetical protein